MNCDTIINYLYLYENVNYDRDRKFDALTSFGHCTGNYCLVSKLIFKTNFSVKAYMLQCCYSYSYSYMFINYSELEQI